MDPLLPAPKKPRWRRWGRRGLALLLGGLVLLPLLPFWVSPIEFNQSLIQRLDLRYGLGTPTLLADTIRSSYAYGLNLLLTRPSRTTPDFAQTVELCAHVFSWAPTYAVVYPTEGFYYYR